MLFDSESSDATVVDIFCEFIEIVIHNILYIRRVYPDTIFESKRKYGVVVHHSMHPGVCEYILHCVDTIGHYLKKNQLKGVFLSLNSGENIVEKYYFKIFNINSDYESNDPFTIKLEQYFSDFCLKLYSCISIFNSLPNNSTFTVQLDVSEYATLEYSQNLAHQGFLWLDVNENETNSSTKIIPLQTIQADFLIIQTYVIQLTQTDSRLTENRC